MKLVSFYEFLQLPVGTIYQEYVVHILGGLCIKGDTRNGNGFLEACLTGSCTMPGSDDGKNPEGFTIDILYLREIGFGNGGLYTASTSTSIQFLIYEEEDRERLAHWLQHPTKAVESMNEDPIVRLVVTK